MFYFFRILDEQRQPFIVAIQISSMTDTNSLTRLPYIVPKNIILEKKLKLVAISQQMVAMIITLL
ncbi:hypothetical protein CXU17_04320 [Akkermansia muciniphila]|nr:hypothetical protein CXU17_04320 [Akkermansia muciniphila]